MKQLTCEMCGSTELLKQEGVFVCQTCGTKYSVEEAKKMMIEGTVEVKGTVKVDKSNETDALLKRVFMFLEKEDWSNADEYCEKVLDIDPAIAEPDLAFVRFKQTVDALQEGTLAGTGRADEHFHVAGAQTDGAVVEYFSAAESLGEVFGAEYGGIVLVGVHGRLSRHHMPALL